MKSLIKTIMSTIALTLLVSPAWSFTIMDGEVDVGGLDQFIDSTDDLEGCGPGSSEAAEECWAELVTGEDLELGTKVEDVPFYVADDNSNIIAFSLASGTGYYVVKNAAGPATGGGPPAGPNAGSSGEGGGWVLMNNLESLGWGVLDLSVIGELLNLCQGNDGCGEELIISHVTPFTGGGDMEVPEPATLALLGLGLLGVGFARRRRSVAS